jgi:hypothetical protein
VSQHIHDEAFFDSLLHGVFMEGAMLYLSIRLWIGRAKHL